MPAPDPHSVASALARSDFAREVVNLAAEIRAHRFPVFCDVLETGPEIHWRRDYRAGIETGTRYFRLIPYLDSRRAGDHKIIWELNRHQHLVTLAQAYLFTGDRANLHEIVAQIESWFFQNPCSRGINWASALEAAFRGLSWIWIDHFAGHDLPHDFRARWLKELYRHGIFIENNLSIYFSPNTHLLGEALALHALGLFFAQSRWKKLGARIMHEQIRCQVRADGGHIEQSSYYHVYALDMFLLHASLAATDSAYLVKLRLMADYLDALLGASRRLPFIGDDDGGRLFHPYGTRDRFGRATLATAALLLDRKEWMVCQSDFDSQARWWLGGNRFAPARGAEPISRLFAGAGLAVMCSGTTQVIVSAGPFGPWNGGHSHAAALSIVARTGDTEILIDPGTYAYTADPGQRDWFRSTAAHSAICIDGLGQAVPAGPFAWKDRPSVQILSWETSARHDLLDAACLYRGFTHRRRVEFRKPGLLLVIDDIDGPPGEHDVEQLWHLGSAGARERFSVSQDAELIESCRSICFAQKEPSPILRVRQRARLPLRLETHVDLSP